MSAERAGLRLPRRPAELIDRKEAVTFQLDGRSITAHRGDTIASALHATGVITLSRSFKYHRRRGLYCCSGACPNCLMTVDGVPNERTCMIKAKEGMRVRRQNGWPSVEHDWLSALERLEAWLPVGFYYKSLVRPRFLWRLGEPLIRRLSGLGEVEPSTTAPPHNQQHEYTHADVAVVGGGGAGMTAALEAAEAGASVVLLDEQPALGGRLRANALPVDGATGRDRDEPGHALASRMAADVEHAPRIAAVLSARVFGAYEGSQLAAATPEGVLHVRAARVIIATGAPGGPLVFQGNDLPGVMLGAAALRLANLYAVAPGRSVVVMAADQSGYEIAAELEAAGVEVIAVLDPSLSATPPSALGAEVIRGRAVRLARGKNRVEAVEVTAADSSASLRTIACDALVVEGPPNPELWLADQGGARIEYDPALGHPAAAELPEGMYLAGRVTGARSMAHSLAQAHYAGRAAAGRHTGRPPPPTARTPAVSPLLPGSGKKRFVCLCEDVTQGDVRTAVSEGFADIQTLKRYTTATMGPCQGRSCHAAFVAASAVAMKKAPELVGATTARPTGAAVTLAQLAGPAHVPIKRTPLHHRQLEMGARMVELGPWERVYSFGSVVDEYHAVRQRVGMIDVSSLGKIEVRGDAVPAVLDKVYTGIMSNLRVGRIRYGVMCTDAGVIMDDGTVARLAEDRWLITTTSGNAEAIEEWLRWWAADFDGDFWITNLTGAYGAMNLAGPRARKTLATVTGADLHGPRSRYMRALEAEVAGVPAVLLRIGFVGETGWEIHCPADRALHVWDALIEAGAEHGIRPFGLEAQRVLRLEKGHIIVTQDTDSVTTPIEAGMEWAVRFSKPDFVGRAALIQLSQRGIVSRLVNFVMVDREVPRDGEPVVAAGEPVGRVTSVRYSPGLDRGMGLAWVPSESATPGRTFDIYSSGRRLVAQVAREVAYDPAGERLRQ